MGKGAINRWGTEFKPGDKVEWTTVGGVTFRGTYLKLEPPSDFSRAYGRQALVRLEDSLDCMMPGLGWQSTWRGGGIESCLIHSLTRNCPRLIRCRWRGCRRSRFRRVRRCS